MTLKTASLLMSFLILLTMAVPIASAEEPATESRSRRFRANLNGNREVPPNDSDATGTARFVLSRDGERLSFILRVRNLETPRQAHIHIGRRGENGPVAATLFRRNQNAPRGEFTGILAEGTITDEDVNAEVVRPGNRPANQERALRDLVREMRRGNAYVNVHTREFPGGEIRGQIRVVVVDRAADEDVDRDRDDFEDEDDDEEDDDFDEDEDFEDEDDDEEDDD